MKWRKGLRIVSYSLPLNVNPLLNLCKSLKTKRYTWTRLQRTLTHILTHSTKTEMSMDEEKVSYLRLLGMSENGRTYLNQYKKKSPIPIVTKRATFNHPQIEIDSRAARIYALGLPEKNRQLAIDLEFSQKPYLYSIKANNTVALFFRLKIF